MHFVVLFTDFLLWLKMSIWGFVRGVKGEGYGLGSARPKSAALGPWSRSPSEAEVPSFKRNKVHAFGELARGACLAWG